VKKLLLIIVLALVIALPLLGAKEFKKIDQWNLGNIGNKGIYAIISRGIIDKDGHVVVRVEKQKTSVLITPKDVFFFAPWGEGGDDLYLCITMCPFGDDIAMVEYMQQRIKIFTKKENKYVWKKTIRLKSTGNNQIMRSLVFLNDKWFIAGPCPLERFQEGKPQTISFLRVRDRDGKLLKDLLISVVENTYKSDQMDFYVVFDGSRVLYLAEDELKVHEISPEKLKVTKEIALKVTDYYKKMPEDFYVYKEKHLSVSGSSIRMRDWEYWQTSYSRIVHVIIEDGYLVIQTRVCDAKLKKFALLFYDLETFELKHTIFIDDMLLDSRAGKYYFYANGNPGKDEEADKCIINIFAFEDKK